MSTLTTLATNCCKKCWANYTRIPRRGFTEEMRGVLFMGFASIMANFAVGSTTRRVRRTGGVVARHVAVIVVRDCFGISVVVDDHGVSYC